MIFDQFGEELVSSELYFQMGFYHNNKRVWIRSAADFNDYIKKSICSSDNVTIWCMGHLYLKSTDDGSTAVTTRIQIQSVTAMIHVSVQDLV